MADISKIKLPNNSEYNLKSLRPANPNEIIPSQTKTYTNFVASGNSDPAGWYFFATVKPTDNDYTKLCYVKYRIRVTAAGRSDSYTDSFVEFWFYNNTVPYYRTSNTIKSTSYRPFYNHLVYRAKQAGLTAGYGHLLGIRMQSSWNPTTAANSRTVQVDILETMDCTVTFFDSMTLYANVPGTGTTNYDGRGEYNGTDQGDRHTGDANDTTTLQYSTSKLTAGSNGIPGYSIVMMKPDGTWEGLTKGNASSATSSTKNTSSFVLGQIYLYWSSTNIAAGAQTGTSVIRDAQDWIDLRYTTNCGTTLTAYKMVYIKGTVSGGLFSLADTWWTQTLPTSNDGFVYIPIGMCYGNGYSACFWGWHGAYYHDGTTLREYYCRASTSMYGVTKLSTSTSSTATDLAATPSAVKTAYDLANSANGIAGQALSGVNGTLIYDHTYTISNGVATFTPHVYQKGVEVTTNYAKSCFVWKYKLASNMSSTPSYVTLTTNNDRTCTVNISTLGYGGYVLGEFTPA